MTINKMISKYNHNIGNISRIKYIVIHYVGAVSSAKANAEYFAACNRNASAHYFVGHDGEIYQSVEDKDIAWHCGASSYKHKGCRNANSIGIELCCKTTGNPSIADNNWYFTDKTFWTAVELTKELMKKYNIPVENVIRHYDVTGKTCPAPFVYNNKNWTWDIFKANLIGNFNPLPEIQNEEKKSESITDNSKIIWDAFIKAGYSKVATAGFMGNLQAESGLRSNNLQDSFEKRLTMTDQQYSDAVSNRTYSKERFVKDSAGYGLAQWTYHTRKRDMYEYIVEQKKKRIDDLEAQLEFLFYELNKYYKSLVAQLKTCVNVKQASDLVLTQFERPANQSDSVKIKRANLGQAFYNMYK